MSRLLNNAYIIALSVILPYPAMADFDLKLGTSLRNDDVKWNNAGSGGTPNVFQEIIWNDINILHILFSFDFNNSLKNDYIKTPVN